MLFAKCKTTRIKDLNMGTRKVNLTQFHDLIGLQRLRCKRFGYCGVNCNLRHNVHSTMSMLVLNLRRYYSLASPKLGKGP